MNWEVLESRIGETSDAYQRPVIRRKIEELVAYFRDCREAGKLPAIPGAVIITSDKRLGFRAVPHHPDLGFLEIPEEPGVLRVLDGQHRLLALHALAAEGTSGGSTSRRLSSTPSTPSRSWSCSSRSTPSTRGSTPPTS